jgi:hypothetical protein
MFIHPPFPFFFRPADQDLDKSNARPFRSHPAGIKHPIIMVTKEQKKNCLPFIFLLFPIDKRSHEKTIFIEQIFSATIHY